MDQHAALLARIAAALEAIAPKPPPPLDLTGAEAFVWRAGARAGEGAARPVAHPSRIPLDLILGADRQRDALLANTLRFATGAPANNALLWGSRGTGKSALVKAVHADVAKRHPLLKLIELSRDDLGRLGDLMARIEDQPARVILFIDDLTFEKDDDGLRALSRCWRAASPAGLSTRSSTPRRTAAISSRAIRARTRRTICFGRTPPKNASP